jgi:hypothetical protein
MKRDLPERSFLFAATEIMDPNRISDLLQECDELIAILTTIIKKMRSKKQ